MADTRAVLIGTGVLLVIVGFLVSNLVCGIGFLFIILGLVMWQREEDDAADYTAKASRGYAGLPPRRRRRGAVLAVLAAIVVLVAALGGYLVYLQLTRDTFTGIRVTAPAGDCWSGTVGSGSSLDGTGVGTCGSRDLALACTASLWVNLTKVTPGTWTMSVSGYRGGLSLGTYSVSGELGAVRGSFVC